MLPADDGLTGSSAPSPPSLLRSTAARVVADAALLVIGMVFATLTARWLGADGKGILSAFALWSVIVFQVVTLGLTEAAIVRSGQAVAPLTHISRATTAALLPLSLVGGALLVGLLAWQVGLETLGGIGITGLAVGALIGNVLGSHMSCMLMAQERIAASSAVAVVGQITTLATFAALGAARPASVSIGVGALFVGSTTSLATGTLLVRAGGVGVRPVFDRGYLVSALRYGLRAQPAVVLFTAASRLDLALVYAIGGAAAAGVYSVSLTYGALVSTAALAVAFVTFPRLARLRELEARALVLRTARMVVLGGVVLAGALAITAAPTFAVLFGGPYRSGIGPAIVLAVAAVPWSLQWIVARGESARDRPNVLLVTFVVNAAVTLSLDLWLVRAEGILGAAASSMVGNCAGAVLAIRMARIPVSELVPGVSDLRELSAAARRATSGLRPPWVRPGRP